MHLFVGLDLMKHNAATAAIININPKKKKNRERGCIIFLTSFCMHVYAFTRVHADTFKRTQCMRAISV